MAKSELVKSFLSNRPADFNKCMTSRVDDALSGRLEKVTSHVRANILSSDYELNMGNFYGDTQSDQSPAGDNHDSQPGDIFSKFMKDFTASI